jgi:hypothetical protein
MSNVTTCTGPVASGGPVNSAVVGRVAFTVDAMDAAGNRATLTHWYSVQYAFAGFFAPLTNLPMMNRGPAGRTFPVKFAFTDASGVFISDPGAISGVTLVPGVCTAAAPAEISGDETTLDVGGLKYDPATGVWHFNLQTSKSQIGCWRLEVRLADGSVHSVGLELR